MKSFRKIDNKEEWQGLLDRALFKTFFHTLEWESFLEQEFKWLKFERYVWQNRPCPQCYSVAGGGEDKALLSIARYNRGGKEHLISHPFCEYGGPLPLTDSVDFNQFKKDAQEQISSSAKIAFHPLVWMPKQDTLRESYFIANLDKKSKQELWQNLRKTTRNEINKAKENGFEIRECDSGKDLQSFYSLYIAKSKQHKIPAYPYSFFKYFLRSQDAEIILAKNNSKVVAGSVFLKYGKIIQYYINASSSKTRGANHLILWTQIEKHSQKQFEIFDFGGTRVGSSLATFKKGWGVNRWAVYVMGQDNRERSGIKRTLWGLLPKGMIKILSSYFIKYKL